MKTTQTKKKETEKKGTEKIAKMKEQGITLIALVITIIILLILAAVTIATLTGENGILTRASEASEKTKQESSEEQVKLAVAGSIETNGEINPNLLTENLKNIEGLTGLPITSLPATVVVDKQEITIGENGSIEIVIRIPVDNEETRPYLPKGATVTEEDLSKGIAIKDSNNNEWTWIIVPKSEMPEGLTFEEVSDYITLETALQTYASNYRSSYKDEWYDGCGLEEDEYELLKQSMLKSVYENGGFYIGKYEVGSFDNPVTAPDTTRKAVIQKGAYPYNYVPCEKAQELSERLTTGGKTSSLMFGIQWDLVLKYLEVNGEWDTTTNEASYYLKTNSGSWGNYSDVNFTVSVENKYAIASNYNLGEWSDIPANYTKQSYSSSGEGVLLSTGATERNMKMNIYDLAGNVGEWTLEKSSTTYFPCVNRGGVCWYKTSNSSAAYGFDLAPGPGYREDIAFRPALW